MDNPVELWIDRWDGRRRVRMRAVGIEETVIAWTPAEAFRAIRRMESSRKSLGGSRRPGQHLRYPKCLRPRRRPWTSPGWFGFVSYDLGRTMILDKPRGKKRVAGPLLRFHRVGEWVRADKNDGRKAIPAGVGAAGTWGAADSGGRGADPPCALAIRSDTRRSYVQKIRAAQRELRAGNAYEINLSQRWTWRFKQTPDPARLFAKISVAMRPRFGFFERTGADAVMGFSPELFFSVNNRQIMAEPIKGTSGGGADLIRSEKDRAELLMITDLFRNDLGKICVPGSIRAAGPMELEIPYARHLFSRVRGRLRAGTGLPEILAALFPSGSVTGAPKISSCKIIDRLEPFCREEAFGTVGAIGATRMEFAVSIRTARLMGRQLRYTAGGGITVYSDPEKEYEETLIKARRFMGCLPV